MGKRLFVSVDLDGMAEAVADAQAAFDDASGLSFVDPEQAHVTLKFLGNTPPQRVGEVADRLETAVEATDVDPFEATFGGYGVFPSIEYVSVVWLGVREGADRLTALHEAIEEAMVDAGFDPEDHDFTPHVTLARMQHAGGKEHVQHVVEEEDPDVGTLEVSEVRLTESVLESDGPTYQTVDAFSL